MSATLDNEPFGSITQQKGAPATIGAVVIGRNEGERLRRCLISVLQDVPLVVYVDSGSTDGSPRLARELGAEVVELDMAVPFTMARGRNAGFRRLLELSPGVEYVQFVDGDCELAEEWIAAAMSVLQSHPNCAAVCGWRRERYPEASIYNRLTDMEWRGPSGDIGYCGGDVVVRARVFRELGGFNERMIAGEEPELSFRIRRNGHSIRRIDRDMTFHDAAIYRFGQWWRRAVRAGHAYAENVWLHGRSPERHYVRRLASALFWGLVVPSAAVGLVPVTRGLSLLLLFGYPALALRVCRHRHKQGNRSRDAIIYALFVVIGKFAHMLGVVRFVWSRCVARRPATLIEYKGASQAVHAANAPGSPNRPSHVDHSKT